MHTMLQTSGRSPKQANGPSSTTQLKRVDSSQNSESSLNSHVRGKKRERSDHGGDPVKRQHSLKSDDADSLQCKITSNLKFEIEMTEKGGVAELEGVDKLMQLMNPVKPEIKLDLSTRSMLAGVIAATDKIEYLNRFVKIRGLSVLDQWLQEIPKGRIGEDSDKPIEEFLLVLLQAMDKLPINLCALQMCNIGKTVNSFRSHKNPEIQKKVRSLVDAWKKRVELEMNDIEENTEASNCGVTTPRGSDASMRIPSSTRNSASRTFSSRSSHGDANVKHEASPTGTGKQASPPSVGQENVPKISAGVTQIKERNNRASQSQDHSSPSNSAKDDEISTNSGSKTAHKMSSSKKGSSYTGISSHGSPKEINSSSSSEKVAALEKRTPSLSLSPMNSLIESCAKHSEISTSSPSPEDNGGMNLLAGVAAAEEVCVAADVGKSKSSAEDDLPEVGDRSQACNDGKSDHKKHGHVDTDRRSHGSEEIIPPELNKFPEISSSDTSNRIAGTDSKSAPSAEKARETEPNKKMLEEENAADGISTPDCISKSKSCRFDDVETEDKVNDGSADEAKPAVEGACKNHTDERKIAAAPDKENKVTISHTSTPEGQRFAHGDHEATDGEEDYASIGTSDGEGKMKFDLNEGFGADEEGIEEPVSSISAGATGVNKMINSSLANPVNAIACSDASTSSNKPVRFPLDFDLNVPDEGLLEEMASRDFDSRADFITENRACSGSGGLVLDLNAAEEANGNGGQCENVRRGFDLNDGPVSDGAHTETFVIDHQANKFPGSGSFSSWLPTGNMYTTANLPSGPFSFPFFPFGTSFPVPSAAGPRIFGPTLHQQFLGTVGALPPSQFPRPYAVGVPGVDFNAGPGVAEAEPGREEVFSLTSGQRFVGGTRALTEEGGARNYFALEKGKQPWQ